MYTSGCFFLFFFYPRFLLVILVLPPFLGYSMVQKKKKEKKKKKFPHVAATAVCGNRFRWLRSLSRGMRELFPQAADAITAVCGPAAECTSRPPYFRQPPDHCRVSPNAFDNYPTTVGQQPQRFRQRRIGLPYIMGHRSFRSCTHRVYIGKLLHSSLCYSE